MKMASGRTRTTTAPQQRMQHAFKKLHEVEKAGPFRLDAMSPALANHMLFLEAKDATVRAKTLAFEHKAREMAKRVCTFDARALVYNQTALFYETNASRVFKKNPSSATGTHATTHAYPRFT